MSVVSAMPTPSQIPQTAAAPAMVDVCAPAEHEEGSRSQVLRWLKSVGERVVRDEPLLEIETDKVTVEIAAPASGVLTEITKAEQDEIVPGALLARIGTGDVATEDVARGDAAAAEAARPVAIAPAEAAPARPHPAPALRSSSSGPLLSPAVKRLVAELAIDPSAVRGSGAGGRVTVDDVLRYARETGERIPGEGVAPACRRIPHSPMRRRIAEHMVRSLLHTAPHVTTVFEADFSAVLAHRARHRDELERRGIALTLTAYIVAACVDAIRAVPETNARWTDDALELLDSINIGVGTAVEGKGLIVPVLHDVPALDLFGIARELGRLVALARADRLAPADVRGGTFTLSNHGVSGSLIAAPIVINQPQAAILGVGKVEKRAVVIEDADSVERADPGAGDDEAAREPRIVARPRGYLTLTIDHRVMDGHRANRFLEVLVSRLERWPVE